MGEFDLTGDETWHVRRPEGDPGADTFPTTTGAVAALAGSSAGSPVVRKFPFAFDTPNLLTGAAVYTPTVGDVLLDAWVEIDTAWDGTTPQGDFGQFLGGETFGNFAEFNGALNMLNADVAAGQVITQSMRTQGTLGGPASGLYQQQSTGNGDFIRALPARFTTTDPIKVCVSQDGTNTGADPASTQGAAVLYLVTCTPV